MLHLEYAVQSIFIIACTGPTAKAGHLVG